MHYTQKDIEAAAEDLGDGYRKSVITLKRVDTAVSMVSTKWHFGGPGTVEYLIHRSGWEVRPSGGCHQRLV